MRRVQKLCETDIRFMRLLDEKEALSHMTTSKFIQKELSARLKEIFQESCTKVKL